MNPPYGRQIKKWIAKAHRESLRGAIVVCLIPARTDTSYFHDYIFPNAEIRFIRNRIYFEQQRIKKDRSPFPACVVIFNNKKNNIMFGWDANFTEKISAQLEISSLESLSHPKKG